MARNKWRPRALTRHANKRHLAISNNQGLGKLHDPVVKSTTLLLRNRSETPTRHLSIPGVISSFRRGENEISALLGSYEALIGSQLPTFRDNL